MDLSLNIVTALYYVPVSDIQSFNPTLSGSVRIQVAGWKPIDFVKGSVNFAIDHGQTKQGRQYNTSLTLNLKSPLKDPGPVMLRIEFESGNILIVGENDLPARFELPQSLTQKNLKLSHKSWHYPYKLVQ